MVRARTVASTGHMVVARRTAGKDTAYCATTHTVASSCGRLVGSCCRFGHCCTEESCQNLQKGASKSVTGELRKEPELRPGELPEARRRRREGASGAGRGWGVACASALGRGNGPCRLLDTLAEIPVPYTPPLREGTCCRFGHSCTRGVTEYP